MKILHLTDIHGQIACAKQAVHNAGDVDVILISGDITNFGYEDSVRKIIEAIRNDSSQLVAIPGNCDYPEVTDYLRKEGISLHAEGRVIDGIGFFGTGLSLPCPGKTPGEAPDETLYKNLEQAAANIPDDIPCVMTVHHPPYGVVNDVPPNGNHVGSHMIRKFVEEFQPLICMSGHIHEGIGIDDIGSTKTLNPGPTKDGNYAVIEISDKVEDIVIKNIYT